MSDKRVAHRINGGHWLMFDANQKVCGCACGMRVDTEDDYDFGDSVIDHIEAVIRAELEPRRVCARCGSGQIQEAASE